MFILAIIFAVAAIVALALAFTVGTTQRVVDRTYGGIKETPGTRKWYILASGVSIVVAAVLTFFSMMFSVDTGSSVVLEDWTGVVAEDSITTPGVHMKAPWQDDISWDVKNQDVTFTGDGTTSHNGQTVAGAEITVIDKDGISANLDIQVLFSIKADETVNLTRGYANQDDFEIKVVENDVKAIPRDVASTFTTVEMFEDRTTLKTRITEGLEDAWADKGVVVDNVNIHGIRYPEDVQQRFKDAQNAQTDLLKAETDAETAKTKASGEAEANRILAESLTAEVLQQRWIDAISKANTIIVPNDFTSLGNLIPQG